MTECGHCSRPISATRIAYAEGVHPVGYCSTRCRRRASNVRARHRLSAAAREAQAALDATAAGRIAAFVEQQGRGTLILWNLIGADTA